MKDITVLNRISKLLENIDYKSAYIEIKTDKDRYTLEKDNPIKVIGFTGGKDEYKSKYK